MKLYEYVNECLRHYGCQKVFGIPGSLIMPIWQNIKDSEIVLCSHEQEASYAATGYAKISKTLACVITTGSPGVTNSISGLASANIDSVPLIYISGRTPISKNGFGLRQEESEFNRKFDSTILLQSVTKKSICINNLNTAAQHIQEAFLCAISGRYGCVHLSIPIDLQNEEIEPVSFNADIDTCSNIPIEKISLKSNPLIIMGWGCWMGNCVDDIYELANTIGAPVLVTSKAYCCIQYNNPFYLGKLGYGYSDILDSFIKNYAPNQILAFGTSLGEKDISLSLEKILTTTELFVFTNDLSSISHKYKQANMIYTENMTVDIRSLMNCRRENFDFSELKQKINYVKDKISLYWKNQISTNDFMSKSILLLNSVADKIVISADAGNHLLDVGALIDPPNIGSLFIDVGIRSMGCGLCSTIGMAFADSSKPYVAITGDGSMLMNGNVLHLIHEYHLPVIVIIFNNHSLGRVRIGQSISQEYIATDILNVDFQNYASSFGLKAYRFSGYDEYTRNISSIISNGESSVVEIITDSDEIPVTLKHNIY